MFPQAWFEGKTLKDGRFQLRRYIDGGTFGAVYEGLDLHLQSPVAIKVLHPPRGGGRDEAWIEQFRKEARLIRLFQHPYVVEVYDYALDTEAGVGFIVMELLDGQRADLVLQEHGGFLPREMLTRFVDQIGSALQNAHEKSLVHRDLKPQNAMLVDRGKPTERFMLLDLGIAKKIEGENRPGDHTMAGALTPSYASPEQVRQRPVDARSDIYSFGSILYEFLTGRTPFLPSLDQFRAILEDEPPGFGDVALDRAIPGDIEALVRRCLAKRPEDRPQTMEEVRGEFLKLADEWKRSVRLTDGSSTLWIDGVPDDETTLSAGTRTRTPEWQQSRGWRAGLAIAPVLVVLMGLAIFLYFYFYVTPPTPPPLDDALLLEATNDRLTVTAGGSESATLRLQRPKNSKHPVTISLSDLPEGVQLSASPPNGGNNGGNYVTLTASADLNAEPRTLPVTIVATSGDERTSLSYQLVVESPPVWEPPGAGAMWRFEPADDPRQGREWLVPIERRNLFTRFDLVFDDGKAVRFVLIEGTPAHIAPYYIMETMVPQWLFQRFVDSAPHLQEDRKQVRDSADPDYPAFNVNAHEAWLFAQWMGGNAPGDGPPQWNLPSREQWDTAAGFADWKAEVDAGGEPQSPWIEGPFHGRWLDGPSAENPDVAVGRQSPVPAATAEDDVSRYGCRDMAGNGRELTRTLLDSPQRELPLLADADTERVQVVTRGASFADPAPYRFEDFEARDIYSWRPAPQSYPGRSPEVGFRLVIAIK